MEAIWMTGQTARHLKRSEQCVRIYVESGKLPATKTANGRLLFRESDVRCLAAKLEQKKTTNSGSQAA